MNIDSIELVDFRCYEKKRISFNNQFNVLIGENGAGKTTILESLAIAINSFVSVVEMRNIRPVRKEDVRRVSFEQNIETKIYTAVSASGHNNENSFNWTIAKTHRDYGFQRGNDLQIKNLAKYYIAELSKDGGRNIILPLFCYMGSGRLWTESTEKAQVFPKGSRLEGYHHCLIAKGHFKRFTEWFKTMELSALQGRETAKQNIDIIKEAVANCIEGWDTIEYSVADDMLMAKKGSGEDMRLLPFQYLSDGQRNMIGIVADIAYRCVLLNPYLGKDSISGTPGVVLIDEIDLHLHPNWQRTIVDRFKKTFPNIQFIATSHSPFIIQSLKKDELIILDKNVVEDKDPFRKSVEEIAEDEMQVSDMPRSSRFQEMMNIAKDYYTLVKQNDNKDSLRIKIDSAKQKLDKLRVFYSDDPAYVAMLSAELEKTENNAANK